MRTPNRGQWWPARWFTGLRLVAVLACLIVVMPAAAARPAPPAAGETQMPGARSLGE